jgi:branched-chain amino acid transport system substrate-binding protein
VARRALVLAGAGVGALGLAGCGGAPGGGDAAAGETGGSGGSAGDKKPVLVGAVVSAAGANAKLGEYQKQAYQLWEEQVSQRNGLLGRPAKLVLYDDGSDPVTAQKQYEKLINEDKVDLLLGPAGQATTQSVSTTTEQNHVPLVAPGTNDADVWKRNYKYVFGVYAPPETFLNGAVDLAVKQGYKTAGIVGEDSKLANAAASATATYAKSKGLQVLVQDKYPLRLSDATATALVAKLKTANPDVVLGASYEPDAIAIAKQLKAADYAPKLFAFAFGAASPEFGTALDKDAEDILGASAWEPSLKTTGNKEFVESFQKKWNREPTAQAATAFAACQILEAAVKKANTLDKDKLRDALASLDTTTILPGKYQVDASGLQTGHTPVVIQWQGKDRVVVWPDAIKTGTAKLPFPAWQGR